ncbi:hypothetical protein GBA52_024761 [Prunus armeniaca]|nr:hypothetical protein GBA52_024761 [Prunus armeniaca]
MNKINSIKKKNVSTRKNKIGEKDMGVTETSSVAVTFDSEKDELWGWGGENSVEYVVSGDDGKLSRVNAQLRASKANIRQL